MTKPIPGRKYSWEFLYQIEASNKTLRSAASSLGLSKERVRQLYEKYGISHTPFKKPQYTTCITCNKPLLPLYRTRPRKCSLCKHANTLVTVSCLQCSSVLIRRKCELKRNKTGAFCNRLCFGQWTGQHNGWRLYHENVLTKLINQDPSLSDLFYTTKEVSRITGRVSSTIRYLIKRGKLEAQSGGGHVFVSKVSVEKLLESRKGYIPK